MKSDYKLISKIDIDNTELVENLKDYIKNINDEKMLKKVFKNSEDCSRFIFNRMDIDNSNPTFEVDDISFLSNGEDIKGYLISRIQKQLSEPISLKVYEYDIPSEYDLSILKERYLYDRINSEIKNQTTQR